MFAARDGRLDARAEALTAYRRSMADRVPAEEWSVEAEAGSILDAEAAHDLHVLAKMYAEVHKE